MAAVTVLALYLPMEALLDAGAGRRGLRTVILLYTAATATCGGVAWFLLPDTDSVAKERSPLLGAMAVVLRRPVVWAQAAIIVCAYSAFKGLDNYSLYAVQVLGLNEVEAARLTAWASYLRPVAAVLTGLAADRSSAGRAIAVAFAVLVPCYALLGMAVPIAAAWLPVIYLNFFASFFAAFRIAGCVLCFAGRNPDAAPPDRRHRRRRVIYRFYAGNLLRSHRRPHPRPGARIARPSALFHVPRGDCPGGPVRRRLVVPNAAKKPVLAVLCTVIWVKVQSGWRPYSQEQGRSIGEFMRSRSYAILTLLFALSSPSAFADINELVTQCESCHGPGGVSAHDDVPTIAGQNAKFLEKALRTYQVWGRPCIKSSYRHGDTTRPKTDMCRVAEGLTGEDSKAISAHFSALPFRAAAQEFDATS